jgi:hypothetical protein
LKKSTIPEWAIARERFQMMGPEDELAQDIQFISFLLVFNSSADYDSLTQMEKTTADRLLRMGVLVEAGGRRSQIMLAKPWKKAFDSKRRKT